jgi:hypothetical protein
MMSFIVMKIVIFKSIFRVVGEVEEKEKREGIYAVLVSFC